MYNVNKADGGQSEVFLASLLASLEPKMYRLFMEMITSIRDSKVLDEFVTLLEQGQVNAAMGLIQRQVTAFATGTTAFYVMSGNMTAQALSGMIGVKVSFDQTNFRAVRLMQDAQFRLIREFTQDQREAMRAVMTSGVAQGMNPRQQARLVTQVIGLNSRQVESINNYRSMLQNNSAEALRRSLRDRRFDRSVDRAASGGEGLTEDQIDRMVSRYTQNQLDYRARMIARTEALRAVNQASYEAFQQAIDSGDVRSDELQHEWITASDNRVRDSHASMHGQKRPFGQPFISGSGSPLLYPGDPSAPASEVIHCRCVLATTLKEV